MGLTNEEMKVYMAHRRTTRRNKLIEMSGGVCARCEATEDLEFNHAKRDSKLFNLSGCHLDKSWDKILEEWEKCELLCREHHVEYTQYQYDTKQIKAWRNRQHIPQKHGTPRCYEETSCRCESCRLAKKFYRAKMIGYWDSI